MAQIWSKHVGLKEASMCTTVVLMQSIYLKIESFCQAFLTCSFAPTFALSLSLVLYSFIYFWASVYTPLIFFHTFSLFFCSSSPILLFPCFILPFSFCAGIKERYADTQHFRMINAVQRALCAPTNVTLLCKLAWELWQNREKMLCGTQMSTEGFKDTETYWGVKCQGGKHG